VIGSNVGQMKKTKEFLIPFIVKARKHHFEYQINKFFEIFDYNEYQDSNIKVNVVLEKKKYAVRVKF
jgi:hypothetical protein